MYRRFVKERETVVETSSQKQAALVAALAHKEVILLAEPKDVEPFGISQ